MPHIVPPRKNAQLMQINKRFQRLVVHPSDALEDDRNREDIIIVDYALEKYDCKPLEAAASISTRFMFRATPAQGLVRKVQLKTLACWCNHCFAGEFQQCSQIPITGEFSTHTIITTVEPANLIEAAAAEIAIEVEENALEHAYNEPVADPAAMEAELNDKTSVAITR
jgi:hypothetical protein